MCIFIFVHFSVCTLRKYIKLIITINSRDEINVEKKFVIPIPKTEAINNVIKKTRISYFRKASEGLEN